MVSTRMSSPRLTLAISVLLVGMATFANSTASPQPLGLLSAYATGRSAINPVASHPSSARSARSAPIILLATLPASRASLASSRTPASRPRVSATRKESVHLTAAGGLTRVREGQVTVDRRQHSSSAGQSIRRHTPANSRRMVFVPTSVSLDYGKPIAKTTHLTVDKVYKK